MNSSNEHILSSNEEMNKVLEYYFERTKIQQANEETFI